MTPRIAADAIIRRSVLDKDNYSSQRCENWNTELHGRSAVAVKPSRAAYQIA